MPEWPHRIKEPGTASWATRTVEVVPADLGRELYEALKAATEVISPVVIQSMPWLNEVLTRYEREVNK